MAEDFPGLRAVLGQRKFDKLLAAYLNDCPSETFTLRNLGARLEAWLRAHREFAPGVERLAIDMVRLEWADIDAFDGPELPRFHRDDLTKLGGETVFRLQPHLHLLDLSYPVDDLLFRTRQTEPDSHMVSNAVLEFPRKSRTRRVSLPKPRKVYLAVYRLHGSVYFKRLTRPSFTLLRALGDGMPLAAALEVPWRQTRRSLDSYREQLREWFEDWASLGWFARQA